VDYQRWKGSLGHLPDYLKIAAMVKTFVRSLFEVVFHDEWAGRLLIDETATKTSS
jgi:hypothetical protein